MASRLYRVKAQFPESGDKEFYSNVLDFVINYPYTYSANGQKKIVYVSPGETPKLPKPYGCMEREVQSDFPVEETANGSYVIYTMPKGPLTITDQTNVYTVTFVDYDNTVLKTERVNCGGTVTLLHRDPPARVTSSSDGIVRLPRSILTSPSRRSLNCRRKRISSWPWSRCGRMHMRAERPSSLSIVANSTSLVPTARSLMQTEGK